jgi:hypothetical protein
MDETRVNVAELSEKELLDEVRRQTHFSHEDSIPLLSPQTPFDSEHPPSEVTFLILTVEFEMHPLFPFLPYLDPHFLRYVLSAPEHLPNISSDNLEDRDSSIPIESRTEERANFEDEDDEPTNPEALSTDPRSFADDIRDTAESNHDDDADHTVFVDAALEKASLQPSKIPSGSFVDEDDLFDL